MRENVLRLHLLGGSPRRQVAKNQRGRNARAFDAGFTRRICGSLPMRWWHCFISIRYHINGLAMLVENVIYESGRLLAGSYWIEWRVIVSTREIWRRRKLVERLCEKLLGSPRVSGQLCCCAHAFPRRRTWSTRMKGSL